jgi:hypothetical protein
MVMGRGTAHWLGPGRVTLALYQMRVLGEE